MQLEMINQEYKIVKNASLKEKILKLLIIAFKLSLAKDKDFTVKNVKVI